MVIDTKYIYKKFAGYFYKNSVPSTYIIDMYTLCVLMVVFSCHY